MSEHKGDCRDIKNGGKRGGDGTPCWYLCVGSRLTQERGIVRMRWECNAKARGVKDKRIVGCANGQRRGLHAACACYVEQQLQDELRADSLASSSSA